MRDAKLIAQRPKVLLDQVGGEAVVSRGHRRVRREDDFARNLHGGGVEVDAFFLHAGADGLEDCESAVAFVQMQHAGRNAHRLQSAVAADAEQQFLADAGAAVSAIEARGQFAVLGRVAFHVRVEQQQVDAAYLDLPHLGFDGAAASVNLHCDRLAIGADGGLHGQLIDVGADVLLLLPAGLVEPLQEVSLPIEQADAHQRNVEVGGALDVVAREDAEAAGVDGQRLVQAELGGEVADGPRAQDSCVGRAPGAVGVQVLLLAAVDSS